MISSLHRYCVGATLTLVGFVLPASQAATSTLLDLNFNTASSGYAGWGSTALTGSPGNGVSTLMPTLPTDVGYANPAFATAPTSGYLALTPNASAVTTGTYFGGWAANVTLATINSPYTAGGLGQTDLSKISFTARVRARGMPANGAVVILELRGSGDNPGVPTAGYKRIRFEPTLLAGNDWTTIGGTLDTAGLTAAKGSTYAFPVAAAQYTALVEVSGFNQFGGAGYVAYNTPSGASNGGRKNPGFGFTGGIRVEVDDVKLVVTDPATTGYLAATTPAQLLRNANFNTGDANWTFFEGAYVSTESWSEDGSAFALIPGWSGSPYAGFMQNSVSFSPVNGDFFTATFRAKFEENYRADQTIVAFMDGGGVNTFYSLDISDEIAPRLGQWHTYKATFRASSANLAAMNGSMSLKIQPLNRTANGTAFSSALIDNVVLTQASAATVGPQIAVKMAGASRLNGETATLTSPLVGKTTPYSLKLENQGGQDLTISSLTTSGNFVFSGATLPIVLAPGESAFVTVSTTPAALGALAGSLTVVSNDKEVADQNIAVTLAATAVTLSDTFDGVATLEQLGWFTFASTTNLANASTFTQSGGAMVMNVNSTNDDFPWLYIVSKPFASPGPIDLASSSIQVALRAEGLYVGPGYTENKVQVRLESLNAAGNVTGRIELGSAVDETTAGAAPGGTAYFTPDGIMDRVVVRLPEGGGYTSVGGTLSTTGVNTSFDVNAPAFRLVVQMSDFDFDLDAGNIVSVDALSLNLATRRFDLANGSFELDGTDPATGAAPSGWAQFPADGVSKNVVSNGAFLYNATLQALDATVTSSSYAGTKVLKVYGQNYYAGGVWQGPSQTGTVYQEYMPGDTTALSAGTVIHARGVAKVISIDPLTGGSSFRYGFKYLNASNEEISRDVTTLGAGSFTANEWTPLVVNSTVPAGVAKVQLISEFVQNAATDSGSVYLDDLSVGYGYVAPSVAVGSETYGLVWSDEFDGTGLNSANWTPELGNGVNGWGNNEVQSYTNSTDNLRVADGVLVIEAIKTGSAWTSARIKTQGKREFKYGKIEFRAKLPSGIGPWPAAWMMGANIDAVSWPACGEIDVMEWKGSTPTVVGHATHSPSRNGGNAISTTAPVTDPSNTFRTYAVVWTAGQVSFSVDGITSGSWSTADTGSPFEKDFFLLLNLAMGGSYVGNTIDPTLTSARYEIDYVRVYQAPAAPVLSGYQTFLQSIGLATDVAFDADADADGVTEGIRYTFGGPAPRLGAGAATLVRDGNSYTYTFDVRDDDSLTLTPEVSYDLTSWNASTNHTLTPTTGAAEGFVRQVLVITATPANRVFFRIRVAN
jgi:beta-glucanase (GH16 family)